MGKIYDVETGEEILYQTQFRNPTNYKLGQGDKDYEFNEGKSITVPDESLTIEEILEKYTRGVMPDIQKVALFEGVEEFDGNERENPVDITDVEEELNDVKERISLAKSRSGRAKQSEATTKNEEEENEVKPEANNLPK